MRIVDVRGRLSRVRHSGSGRRCSGPCGQASQAPGTKIFPIALNAISIVLFLSSFALKYYLGTKNMQRNMERRAAQIIAARRGTLIARPDQLTGSGRIYLVQMGAHNAPYSLHDFAEWLRSKYGLDVEILPSVALDRAAWDRGRGQYVAELLTDQLKREHPSLAQDPQAYLIGFTDADMYHVSNIWKSAFTHRDGRAAVVSADGMQDSMWLRRILLRDVGVLYWHLALNYDPASLLQQDIDPDLPLEDIYESDLNPERTQWGRSEGEPCMFFTYSAKSGIGPQPGHLIRSCFDIDDDAITRDKSAEVFEVDLRLGLLLDRHTDFYLPDTIPIQFQRATRDGWPKPMGFGISGSHNYDSFLGCDEDMRTVTIYGAYHNFNLKRVPSWLSSLWLAKYVDADYSGRMAEMRWRTIHFEHFELKRYNGEVETYLPCGGGSPPCYQVGFRNARGEALVFERDKQRKLTSLESPNHNELRFTYDDAGRIAELGDSRGRRVDYAYDAGGRLVRVSYPSGEVLYYEYDNTQHLLTFSSAPDAKTKPVVLLRNEYEHGRISKQTFSDGKVYTYTYQLGDDADSIRGATVLTRRRDIRGRHKGIGFGGARTAGAT